MLAYLPAAFLVMAFSCPLTFVNSEDLTCIPEQGPRDSDSEWALELLTSTANHGAVHSSVLQHKELDYSHSARKQEAPFGPLAVRLHPLNTL